jgi:uroporphyrin-III C-methyltransferase
MTTTTGGESTDDRRCPGVVHLVGAGPGDPELMTLKGARVLGAADVVVYDRLVEPRVLDMAAPGAERIFAGKRRDNHFMRQVEINALLVNRAWRGQRVVRLKGGDPMIFGRAGEELEALAAAGVPFEVVPGVTAAAGCAASAAIPLTHRDHARTLVFATGHTQHGEPDLDWDALCRAGQTLVFYMGHKTIHRLCSRLVAHGLPPELPAAVVENGTLPGQRVIRATLATIAAEVDAAALEGPALLVVGEVAGLTFGEVANEAIRRAAAREVADVAP